MTQEMLHDPVGMIHNPVLRGFNPDPSFLRVGEDYYLATSTFEWYPGVSLYHSRDLANWRLVARPLNRAALLDMRGNPDSGGIWAPCLSHDGGKFWLVYTDVKRIDGSFKDAHNYITCCDSIDGTWRDPWYVHSTGFDPSLFHDDDGRKWFVSMRWNHRGKGTGVNPAHDAFDGIVLQEWSPARGLIGPVTNIYAGTQRGLTEAPHLFKRDGYYYLTTAEGGTGYDHAVTMARARDIRGPYETHPDLHVVTAAGSGGPLQRTGHGQYVETHWGRHYHSFLTGRPIAGPDGTGQFCPCGRETGLEEVVWRDGWLYLAAGGQVPRAVLPAPASPQPDNAPPLYHDLPRAKAQGAAVVLSSNPVADLVVGLDVVSLAGRVPPEPASFMDAPLPAGGRRYDFRTGLEMDFQWLRSPDPARLFRLDDKGLTLIGRESLGSWFEQSLVARRQTDLRYRAETTLTDFAPADTHQAAGLVTYYNAHKLHALLVEGDGAGGRRIFIASCPGRLSGALDYPVSPVALSAGPVDLRVTVDHASQQFWWRQAGAEWSPLGPALNAAVISDEGGRGEHASFTGAFTGVFAMDISGRGCHASFDHFDYLPESP